MTRNRNKRTGLAICVIAVVSIAAGSLLTAGLVHSSEVAADANRVFELRIYHALPGKLPALESRFRNNTSRLLAKHDLKVVGYWVPDEAPGADNRFIWVLAHASREEAKRNWEALWADPEFQELVKAEQGEKLVDRVEVTYLRPTDFSPMK
jgi:hypothetical protein